MINKKARGNSPASAPRRPAGMVPSEARVAGREPSSAQPLGWATASDAGEAAERLFRQVQNYLANNWVLADKLMV